jgi:hypothetical protein
MRRATLMMTGPDRPRQVSVSDTASWSVKNLTRPPPQNANPSKAPRPSDSIIMFNHAFLLAVHWRLACIQTVE